MKTKEHTGPVTQALVAHASMWTATEIPFAHTLEWQHHGEDGWQPVLRSDREYDLDDQSWRSGDFQDWYVAEAYVQSLDEDPGQDDEIRYWDPQPQFWGHQRDIGGDKAELERMCGNWPFPLPDPNIDYRAQYLELCLNKE